MATDYEIAVQRLTGLANNPKTPAAVAADLALVLMAAGDGDHASGALFIELRKHAHELCEGYPFTDKDNEWVLLWALTEGFKGTRLACDDLHKQIADLAMLVVRLCRVSTSPKLTQQATDYLARKGLLGTFNILRESEEAAGKST